MVVALACALSESALSASQLRAREARGGGGHGCCVRGGGCCMRVQVACVKRAWLSCCVKRAWLSCRWLKIARQKDGQFGLVFWLRDK